MLRLSRERQLVALDFEFTDVDDDSARHLLELDLHRVNTYRTRVSDQLNEEFEQLLESNRVPP